MKYPIDHDGAIAQNREKYFIFAKTGKKTKKGEDLYEMYSVRKTSFKGSEEGNIIKKCRIMCTSKNLEKRMEKESFHWTKFSEFKEFTIYLDKLNPKRKYGEQIIDNYFICINAEPTRKEKKIKPYFMRNQ